MIPKGPFTLSKSDVKVTSLTDGTTVSVELFTLSDFKDQRKNFAFTFAFTQCE